MKGRQAGLLLIGVMLGALVASVTWGLLGTHSAQAQRGNYFVDIVTLEGRTNEIGEFKIAHGVSDGKILGMSVAVHDARGPWYTLDTAGGAGHAFWWTTLDAMGFIDDGRFANQPVRVVLFVGYPQG